MLDFIHAERELSLDHWRYRLLHWAFGYEQGKRKAPEFFYSHYCPLFHMTNMLAVLIPFIFLFKFGLAVGRLIINGVFYLLSFLPDFEPTDEERIITTIEECIEGNYTIDALIHYLNNNSISYSSVEYLKELWTKTELRLNKQKELKAKQEQNSKEKMILFVRLSEVLIKLGLFAFYTVLAICSLYLAVKLGGFIGFGGYSVFIWLLELNWFSVITLATKIIILSGVLILISMFLLSKLERYSDKILFPFVILFDLVKSFFSTVFKIINKFFDFLAEVYSNNCPPIKIIDE